MPSKSRMTINFSSKETLKMVELEAMKNKVSKSRVVEEMLRFAYSERIKNGSYFTEERPFLRSKNGLPVDLFKSDLRINLLQLADATRRHCAPERFTVSSDFIIPNSPHHEKSDLLREINSRKINRTQVRNESQKIIKEQSIIHTNEMVRRLFNVAKTAPDYILIFTTGVHINYLMPLKTQSEIYFHVTAEMYAIPIFMNKINNKHLLDFDFLNVRHRTFSDVATKGWDRSKYSHLIYLDVNHEKTLKQKNSGYFIGVLHDVEKPLLEPKGFKSHEIYLEDKKIHNIQIKHHFDARVVTFKMITNGIPTPKKTINNNNDRDNF